MLRYGAFLVSEAHNHLRAYNSSVPKSTWSWGFNGFGNTRWRLYYCSWVHLKAERQREEADVNEQE